MIPRKKIPPRKWVFRGIFRGIPRGIFVDIFDHLAIIFKLLVFLFNKFNALKNNFEFIFFKLYVFKKYLSIKYLNLVVFWKTSTDLFLYKLLFYLAEWLIGNTYLIISPLHIKKMLFCHFGEFLLILHLEKLCMDFNLEKLCKDFNFFVIRCSFMSNWDIWCRNFIIFYLIYFSICFFFSYTRLSYFFITMAIYFNRGFE